MSRPYPQNATNNHSPFNRQFHNGPSNSNSSSPASGTPTSFKTNVNRAKTKRWVEAKSYSYDGDDWGDVDDYDEYGGYDEPTPQAKPTGLRQQGQTASSTAAGNYDIGGRSNSFNRGDERRAFSAGTPQYKHQNINDGPMDHHQSITQHAPAPADLITQELYTQQAQPQYQQPHPSGSSGSRTNIELESATSGLADQQQPGNYRGILHSDSSRPLTSGAKSQSITSSSSSVDFHSRRDFSPSAVPPPLSTRASPAPRSTGDFVPPPRKSSLSQQGPTLSSGPGDATLENPLTSEPRDRTTSNPSKPLPFVRPADIYRRMQEEQARERQPQESSRPNMDVIVNEQAVDGRSDQSGLQPDAESSRGVPAGRRTSFDTDDAISGRRLKPLLDPVAERKSEYGLNSLGGSQLLPDVARVSGFGESFLGSLGHSDEHTSSQPSSTSTAKYDRDDTNSQLHSSLGFRSIVDQAFDGSNEVPETLSSMAGSDIARSNSESTNALSPIISRAPSTANTDVKAKGAEAREESIPIITEEPGESISRPTSSDAPSTPKATIRGAPPAQSSRPGSSGSIPDFLSGHRRDISTSSPENSPARKRALETGGRFRQPQEAEIAMATPIEPYFPESSRLFTQEPEAPSTLVTKTRVSTQEAQSSKVNSIDTNVESLNNTEPRDPRQLGSPVGNISPLSRADSPSKSRVRDLAGKFDAVNVSRRGSENSSSMQNDASGPTAPMLEGPSLPRPGNSRFKSFRPQIPGGWESSTSVIPAQQEKPSDLSGCDEMVASKKTNIHHYARTEAPGPDNNSTADIDITPTTVKRSLSKSPEKDPSGNPFSAVTAAGAVLADAFVAAVGMNQHEPSAKPEDFQAARGPSAFLKDGEVHPEMPKPRIERLNDSDSEIVATPSVDGNAQSYEQSPTSTSDSFPPVVPLKQKPRKIDTENNLTSPYHRPQILPTLSTDTSPYDYESDRLRKEIVRELSPHAEHYERDDTHTRTVAGVDGERLSVNIASRNQAHDSIGLPREYESYWNGSASEDDPSRPASGQQQMPLLSLQGVEQSTDERAASEKDGINEQRLPNSIPEARPAPIAHRFSWELDPEQMNPLQQPSNVESLITVQTDHQLSDILQSLPDQAIQPAVVAANPEDLKQEPIGTDGVNEDDIRDSSPLGVTGIGPDINEAALQELPRSIHENRLSSSAPQSSHHDTNEEYNKTQNASEEPDLPPPPLPTEQPKVPAFREILTLKTPSDRIKSLDNARQHFAEMNTGLAHWIAATMNDLPEHSALVKNGGQFGTGTSDQKISPSRSKLAGFRLSSVQPLQQPYYQQYLNASSQPVTSNPTSTAQTSAAHAPGFNHTQSGHIGNRHQVQAKGKDLLHSAGKFGGKANVAAKGLFSKSKNKLRGAGGADKVSSSSSLSTNPPFRESQSLPQPLPQEEIQSQISTSSSLGNTVTTEQSAILPFEVSSKPPENVGLYAQLGSGSASLSEGDYNARMENGRVKGQTDDSAGDAQITNIPGTQEHSQSNTEASRPNTVTTRKSASILPGPTEAAKPDRETPIGLQSAVATTSSNQTPTQTSFVNNRWLSAILPASNPVSYQNEEVSRLPQSEVKDSYVQGTSSTAQSYRHEESIGRQELGREPMIPDLRNATEQGNKLSISSQFVHQQVSIVGGDSSRGKRASLQDAPESSLSPRVSEDSEGTYKTADSGENLRTQAPDLASTVNIKPSVSPVYDPSVSQNSDRQVVPSKFPRNRLGEPSDDLLAPRQDRPFSFIDSGSRHSAKPSENVSYRSSLDIPAQDYQARHHSPVSPQRSEFTQSTSADPVHHDINHDFDAQDEQTHSKPSRPLSFSRPFQDPNLQDHPAFRHEEHELESTDLPAQYYPAQLRRNETMLARQQATEYQIEGIGPPQVDEQRSNPRSRRSSRSSAFFKRLSGVPKGDLPPLPNDTEEQSFQPATATDAEVSKKTRRVSLFRTLTGRTDSNSSRSKENIPPVPMRSQTDPYQPATNTLSHRTNLSASISAKKDDSARKRGKLQRSSTTGITSPDGGKRKRFSGLGTIFGRSKQRQSSASVPNTQPAYDQQLHSRESAQRPHPPRQDSAYYVNSQVFNNHPGPNSRPQQGPNYVQPPLEGYYSPDRLSGNFSQGFINGQRSPRLVPQDPDISGYSHHHHTPSQQSGIEPPWQSEPQSWSLNGQATTSPYHGDNYATPHSYHTTNGSYDSSFNRRDHSGFSHRHGTSSIHVPPVTSNSTWVQSPDRYSAPNSTIITSQPPFSSSSPASTSAPAPHRTFRGPLKSSMKKPPPTGYHEADTVPHHRKETSRSESPALPPTPPPKDEWLPMSQPALLQSSSQSQRRDSSYLRAATTASFYPYPKRYTQEEEEDSSSREQVTPSRLSLPALQTDISASSTPIHDSHSHSPFTHPLTPEEVRKARQREIESSHVSPDNTNRTSAVGMIGMEKGKGMDSTTRRSLAGSNDESKVGGAGKMNALLRQQEQQLQQGTRKEDDDDDERIVMSGASYPGMEWQPPQPERLEDGDGHGNGKGNGYGYPAWEGGR